MKTFTQSISKAEMLAEVQKHRKADQMIKGTYGEGSGKNFKGCAVGCSINSINILRGKRYQRNNHKVYETELGIPEWLARLEDTIFEGLPTDKSKLWPEQFIKAIPEGVDLEPIKWKFSAYLMRENIDRVLSLDIPDELKEQVVKSIRQVLSVHETAIKTGSWDESAAESAAWSAAWSAESAAWSAAWSAGSAAESAAWSAGSAAWSAWSAAESAAESAAWSAGSAAESAWSAAFVKHSKKLLALLRATK